MKKYEILVKWIDPITGDEKEKEYYYSNDIISFSKMVKKYNKENRKNEQCIIVRFINLILLKEKLLLRLDKNDIYYGFTESIIDNFNAIEKEALERNIIYKCGYYNNFQPIYDLR